MRRRPCSPSGITWTCAARNFLQLQVYPCIHPNHSLHNPLPNLRTHRPTPASHYSSLYDEVPPPPERSRIHTHFVKRALEGAEQNSILGVPPPPLVDGSEVAQTYTDRRHLARMRCGHHLALRAYEHRIRPEVSPLCRWCAGSDETTPHLMAECPVLAPQRLAFGIGSTLDLWTFPSRSADYLRALGLFP
jgi:hypothetical protein